MRNHTDATVGRYIRKCSNTLETLTLHEMRLNGQCLQQAQGGQLRSLTLKRVKWLEIRKVAAVAHKNPYLTKFALEHYTKRGHTHVNVEELIVKMKYLRSLELRGYRFEKFATVAALPYLTDLDLCISNVIEINRLMQAMTLEYRSRIRRLQMTVDYVLSDAAVMGFSRLQALEDLKLIVSVDGAALNRIYERLGDCRQLTSFELISFNEEDTDLAEPCLRMSQLRSLKISLHKNAHNLTAIASLQHLVWLDLHLSSCRCESYTQANNVDVNELMLLLAERNTVQELSLRLLPEIQLTPATMKRCGEQFTSLQFFKYRGQLVEQSFFYSLNVFRNLIEVIYVNTPTITTAVTGVEMDVVALQNMVQTMEWLRRFTIVVGWPKEMYRNARDLAESRSGLEVVVRAKEPEFKLRGVEQK